MNYLWTREATKQKFTESLKQDFFAETIEWQLHNNYAFNHHHGKYNPSGYLDEIHGKTQFIQHMAEIGSRFYYHRRL